MKEDVEKQSEEVRLFIIENDQQEQTGIVAFYFIDQRHRHAEFAIALDPKHQGKGYATIVTRRAIDYSFSILNLRKVYLIVADINEKASHIYEKVGFKFEGKLREHYFINGNYHDAIVMGFLLTVIGRSSGSRLLINNTNHRIGTSSA